MSAVAPTAKQCSRCGASKPLDEFKADPRMKLGKSSYCRPCSAAYARERYAKNPERARAIQRAYATRVRTPEQTRARHLWNKYRLRVSEYDALLAAQDGRCAICCTDEPGGRGDWHVDHCHESKKIRGLLCTGCNLGLGHFRDDPQRLRAAIHYLQEKS
jgi:hypothetical protein